MRTSKSLYFLASAFILSTSFSNLSFAANVKPPVKKRAALAVDNNSSLNPQVKAQLNQALGLVNRGQYQQAVPILYRLTRRPELESQRMQLKYILGSSLLNVGLPQIAAFQFAEVIKNGSSRYVRQSIEQLSLAADALGDESLLNYAKSRVTEKKSSISDWAKSKCITVSSLRPSMFSIECRSTVAMAFKPCTIVDFAILR